MIKAKPFNIPKKMVWEAFQSVKANQGAAGALSTYEGVLAIEHAGPLTKHELREGGCVRNFVPDPKLIAAYLLIICGGEQMASGAEM